MLKSMCIGCLLWMLGSSAWAQSSSVMRVGLYSGRDAVKSIHIAAGTTCSFKFPASVVNLLLGNARSFKAQAVAEDIVAIKPLTDEGGLFTNLQVILEDKRIITIEIHTGGLEDSTSQVTFYDYGKSDDAAVLEKQKVALETKFKEKEKNLEDSFKETEQNNYMRDMLYSYQHKSVAGGRVIKGIGLFPVELSIRTNDRVFLKLEVRNTSSSPYRIANIQVMERIEGGFLGRGTKKESTVPSNIMCSKEDLLVAVDSKETCVVSFERPKRLSKEVQVGLKLVEAAADSRQVYIRRVLEIYN